MKKRILCMVLSLVMIFSTIAVCADETGDITIYISMSVYGELAEDAGGEEMAYVEVNLSGESTYTLDDAFSAFHEQYYPYGAEGYASSEGDWGLQVDRLWGDESYNFGYQVNGGTESVMGPGHVIEDGDYIDAFVYKSLYPDNEAYAKFSENEMSVYPGEEFSVTLLYVSGYDDNWNNVFSFCEGATILINGEETDIVTDEEGTATITLYDEGRTIISAKMEKYVNDVAVPAIVAPVCIVDVEESPNLDIMHNIAEYYNEIDFEDAGGNLPWIIADMAIYEELFSDSESIWADEKKEEALRHIIKDAKDATKPGDMAKDILALRALGYDARSIYTEEFEKVDLVEKLTDLVDKGDEYVTNIYTLPYVIIALSQAEDYATCEQMETLVNYAIESCESWQSVENGTDALAPMILALAPYYDTNDDVGELLDESILILKGEQRDDGLIDGFSGYEPASTGLAICAFSAMEIDAETIINGEKNLIEGMLSTANEEQNGFGNPFATEQGFRGLLAWQLLLKNSEKAMYDFSDYPFSEANVSGFEFCPVIFEVSPDEASVEIDGAEEILKNHFDLDSGTYTYSVSASGYVTKTDTFEITEEEAENREAKTISVSLKKKGSGNGGGGAVIKFEDEDEGEDLADNSEKTYNTEGIFPDVSTSDWFYPAVQYVFQKELFFGTQNGFEPNAPMTRAMLVTVLYRLASPGEKYQNNPFLDVRGDAWFLDSTAWAWENKIISGVSESEFAPDMPITREQLATIFYRYARYCKVEKAKNHLEALSYNDFDEISEYARDAVEYVSKTGVMNGMGDGTFLPQKNATRAEVATMLMRFCGEN